MRKDFEIPLRNNVKFKIVVKNKRKAMIINKHVFLTNKTELIKIRDLINEFLEWEQEQKK